MEFDFPGLSIIDKVCLLIRLCEDQLKKKGNALMTAKGCLLFFKAFFKEVIANENQLKKELDYKYIQVDSYRKRFNDQEEENIYILKQGRKEEFQLKRLIILEYLESETGNEIPSFCEWLRYKSLSVSPCYQKLLELLSVRVYFYHIENILVNASQMLSTSDKLELKEMAIAMSEKSERVRLQIVVESINANSRNELRNFLNEFRDNL